MIVSGISVRAEILPAEDQGAPVGHAGAESSEFAALLSLIVAGPMGHRHSAAATGSFLDALPEEGSTNPDISRPAGVAAIDEALIHPLAGEPRGQQNSVSEILLQLSKGSAFTSEMQLSRSIPLAPEPRDGPEVFPPRESEIDDHSVSGGATRDQESWVNHPPALLYSFNASVMVNAEQAVPRELSVVLQSPLTEGDPPKLRSAAEIGNKTLDTPVSLNADKRADLFQPPMNDQPMGGPVVEDKPLVLDVYGGKAPRHSVPLNPAEQPNFAETELKSLEQSRLLSEGEPNSRVMPWSSAIVNKVQSPDAQNGKQEFSYQQKASTRSGETFPIATETKIESAWRDAVPFQLTHTIDKVPATIEGESQRIDWRAVIDRVFGEISGRIHIGKQQAVLQLDPPELGKLQIDIHMEGDKLAARILTETQESRMLIEAHLPELRQALVENRVELVDVRIDSGTWSGQRGDGQQAQQESGERRQTAHAFSDLKTGHSEKRESARHPSLALEAGRVSMWA